MAEDSSKTSSAFRRIAKGNVAENMPINSEYCEITLTELNPIIDGGLAANIKDVTATSVDPSGKKTSSSLKIGNTIKAKWIRANDGNRVTPPNMRRGEPVSVYMLADIDTYYFTDDSAPGMKRLETIINRYSATSDDGATLDSSNCYETVMSTHYKRMYIKTSNANGEPFIFSIDLDAGQGIFSVSNDVGDRIMLDAMSKTIIGQNSAGSIIQIQGDTATVSAKNITLQGENISLVASTMLKLKAAAIKMIGSISMSKS